MANTSNQVRIPAYGCGILRKIGESFQRLSSKLESEPSLQDVADDIGLDESSVLNLVRSHQSPFSLNETLPWIESDSDDRDIALIDRIEDRSTPYPDEISESKELTETIKKTLSTLVGREQEIIERRFGLGQNYDYDETLEEVGHRFDLTRERIRQIEAKAINKLRNPPRSRLLRRFQQHKK